VTHAPPVSGDLSARCADHSAPAIGACERCGAFACDRCGFREREHVRCRRCGSPPAERPPAQATAALILAAVGIMCPPLSLLGIGLAIAWRLRSGARPPLGVQYARWAVVVGLLSLAAGAGMYTLMARLVAATKATVQASEEKPGAQGAPSADPVQGGEEG